MAEKLIDAFVNLTKVKSLVTLSLTLGMLLLLSGKWSPSQEILALYCTSYGAVMTYYFTKDKSKADEADSERVVTETPISTSLIGFNLDDANGEFTEDEPEE